MSKLIFRSLWQGIVRLSFPPSVRNQPPKSYRTGFMRCTWATIAVLLYLVAIVMLGDQVSANNSEVYQLIVGGLIVAGVTAFFAPRLNVYLFQLTPRGQRSQLKKKKLSAKSDPKNKSNSNSPSNQSRQNQADSRSKSSDK